MSWNLEASYQQCRRLTRATATNFYYSFLVLPRAKRRGMWALYAFLRHTDDLGDNDSPADSRRVALQQWRGSLERALAGEFDSPLLPAVADTLTRFNIPSESLFTVIDGVLMDQQSRHYETFAELSDYCHKVAGVVGWACLHIWGFRNDPRVAELAEQCGLAFQLTNILRDLQEDARAGRVYLPGEDLRRFAYTADDLRAGRFDEHFRALMQFEIARADECYQRAEQLTLYLSADGQAAYRAMFGIYRGLLDEIRRRGGDVFSSRVRLSTWRKLGIAARAAIGVG